MTKKKTNRTILLVSLLMCLGQTAYSDMVWLAKPCIEGVGPVTMTAPTGDNSLFLHYGGAGTPETADFKVDVSNAHDYDELVENGQILDVADAGLEETDTTWACPPISGEMSQGAFTSRFTPGNTVKHGIKITATVKEGHILSYNNGNYDSPFEQSLDPSSYLTTFQVYVLLSPGAYKYYEDGTFKSPGQSDANCPTDKMNVLATTHDLGEEVTWTGVWACPGLVESPHNKYTPNILTWTSSGVSDNGIVGGMRGTIAYAPKLIASGLYRAGGETENPSPGTLGVWANIVFDNAGPIEVAAANCVLQAAGTGVQFQWSFVACSRIDNVGQKIVNQFCASLSNSAYDFDLSDLNIAGSVTAHSNNQVVNGSIAIDMKVSVNDDSRWGDGDSWIIERSGSADWQTRYGCTKPVYNSN